MIELALIVVGCAAIPAAFILGLWVAWRDVADLEDELEGERTDRRIAEHERDALAKELTNRDFWELVSGDEVK